MEVAPISIDVSDIDKNNLRKKLLQILINREYNDVQDVVF